MKVTWSPLGIERVTVIARYIAQDNPTAARNWVDTIFEKVGQLEFMPESGRMVPEIQQNDFRELLYGNYRIIYRVGDEQGSTLTVRHGRQLLPIVEILPDLDKPSTSEVH